VLFVIYTLLSYISYKSLFCFVFVDIVHVVNDKIFHHQLVRDGRKHAIYSFALVLI
jgi:hypothetical protein